MRYSFCSCSLKRISATSMPLRFLDSAQHTAFRWQRPMATIHPGLTLCADRANQFGLAGNCSDATSVPADPHWTRRDCRLGAASPHHGAHFDVCGVCHNNTQAQAWVGVPGGAANAHGQITTLTPPQQAPGAAWPNPLPNWNGFRTRLCRTCEEVEQAKCHYYITNPADPNTTVAHPPNMAEMVQWPIDRCTCLYYLNGVQGPPDHPIRYCRLDHADVWTDLEQTRNHNAEWLLNTSIDKKGQLCMASDRTKRTRRSVRNSSYRACRCGRTVDLNGRNPEVLLCMACQGLVHVVLPGTLGSRSQPPFRHNNKRRNVKYRRALEPVQLFRRRLPHTDND